MLLSRYFSRDCTSWTRRLKLLGIQKDSLRCLSLTAVNSEVIKVQLDHELEKKFSEKELKPKRHTGINKLRSISIPTKIQKAIVKAAGDFPLKGIAESGELFDRYLRARKTPMEPALLKQKVKEIEELVLSDPKKHKIPEIPPLESDDIQIRMFNARKDQRVKQIVKQRVYSWQPIIYDQHKAFLYLVSRAAEEYSVITRILNEIQKRDPTFQPQSFFDFGSGVGTGTWAVSELWKPSIFEYYLVDSSKHMNDLSELILREGDENKAMSLREVYFRQFLPAKEHKYDLVLSAYSMFELPSLKHRLEVANNLWNKSSEYLIFVENGTNAGFQVLNEIRDFFLELQRVSQEAAFIFAPCPHESPCPRVALEDGTPCNFEASFNTLPFLGPSITKKSSFSYLVIKKGLPNEVEDRWPRIVRPTLLRHKHVVCRMCTKEGEIKEGIFTAAKHGKLAYKCAKYSNLGDRLPIKILEPDEVPSDDDEE